MTFRGLQPSVKMLHLWLEVRLLHVLEGLPQQAGVPYDTGRYEGAIKPLQARSRVDAPHKACLGAINRAGNDAITAWV